MQGFAEKKSKVLKKKVTPVQGLQEGFQEVHCTRAQA